MTSSPGLRILMRGEHSVRDDAIHPNAWKVLRRLHGAGHTAYLVGGTVRDLFLGRQPKDFDVATTARPNDIKSLFRNAFMIGRRFRLAHVKFQENIIEVATFRRESDRFEEPEEEGGKGKVLRFYGTPEEDARRRDFTINGLFYDPFLGNVIDYVGGLGDMERRLVRTITPPRQSYEEDPVRMIRAVRAAARLGFAIEAETHESILALRQLIMRCPKARLLEELLILLKYSSAERSLRLLWQVGLMEHLLPIHHAYLVRRNHIPLESARPDVLFDLFSMLDLDPSGVDASVLFALLIFPLHLDQAGIQPALFWQGRMGGGTLTAIEALFNEFATSIDAPKRFRARALEILSVQPRLYLRQSHIRPEKFAHKPYFWDSFRFFQIATRASDLDVTQEIHTWEKFEPKPAPPPRPHGPPAAGGSHVSSPDQHRSRHGRNRRHRRHGPGRPGDPPQNARPETPTTPSSPPVS